MKLDEGHAQTEQHETVCLIIGRNLGDAVIQSQFFHELIQRKFAKRYIVWTRPQVAFLFENLPECTVITSPFPVGTSKQFDRKGLQQFIAAVRALRKQRPMVSLDMIGDFRERIFARLIGSSKHLHIGWAVDHPFRSIIRNPYGSGRPSCIVPASVVNIYQAYSAFLNALVSDDNASGIHINNKQKPEREHLHRIGLHPFASQACKLWPQENWCKLAAALQKTGARITVYGTPSERAELSQIFGLLSVPVEYFTKSIPEFSKDVAELDLMIGLDSFSVHVAELHSVRSVMLNACNHPTLWVPPNCTALSTSGGCATYPCLNVPQCGNSSAPFACIKAIQVEDVIKATYTQSFR